MRIGIEETSLTEALKTLARQAGISIRFPPEAKAPMKAVDGSTLPEPTVSLRFENCVAEGASFSGDRRRSGVGKTQPNNHSLTESNRDKGSRPISPADAAQTDPQCRKHQGRYRWPQRRSRACSMRSPIVSSKSSTAFASRAGRKIAPSDCLRYSTSSRKRRTILRRVHLVEHSVEAVIIERQEQVDRYRR